MIHDLTGAGQVERQTDFLVIGAGTVGLVLATELAALGKRVICLESGGHEQKSETHPLNVTEQAGTIYAGAEHGRFRCLGGSSTRWGGALIPFQAPDMNNADWPIDWAELAPYLPKVEAFFGLPLGPYEEPQLLPDADFLARLAKWPAFQKRNVYSLVRERAEAINGPEIWINATATQFVVENGLLIRVTAQAPDGSSLNVHAKETVLAAGAIESTRLLLLLERQNPGSIRGKNLGTGFHDHLSAVVAELQALDRNALNQIVGFRFLSGGGMRNLRFELSPTSQLRESLSPCFAHIGFADTQGGFAALRDAFRALQRRRLPDAEVLLRMLAGMPWLLRATWWRFFHKRLLFPEKARLELHMVIEQEAIAENYIDLSSQATDSFGLPLAKINWRVRPTDITAMEHAVDEFEKSWAKSSLAQLAKIRRRTTEEIAVEMEAGGGIYHPGGSTRMAISPDRGTVDQNLRVFGILNLATCATSVLPTGGGANPTMMLMLLAMRYINQVHY